MDVLVLHLSCKLNAGGIIIDLVGFTGAHKTEPLCLTRNIGRHSGRVTVDPVTAQGYGGFVGHADAGTVNVVVFDGSFKSLGDAEPDVREEMSLFRMVPEDWDRTLTPATDPWIMLSLTTKFSGPPVYTGPLTAL